MRLIPDKSGPGDRPDIEPRALLEFERAWPDDTPSKGRAIRQRFGIPPTRYHQLLDLAIDRPEVLAREPVLVGRLLRLRDIRRRVRSRARFGPAVRPG